jgi:hypothetical protein
MFIQFLIIGFSFFALSRTILNFKKGQMTINNLIFWSSLWLVIIVVALLPQITTPLAHFLGVGRGSDVTIYLSILLIFYLLFKIFAHLEKIDYEITQIVRKKALKKEHEK